ncbi:hypothetical protein Sta7437_4739 (plasmid) [Stanieria cyanosphaera PCC 7437]|uniref:Uncharacterized protein n=1 Tax=Stanieria cyanosphaera (strain ATCC 29371 / PCC 7437) TaxID=111780 RepID=K9Y015_STAC7|nr:DUF6714 family protein [Stanieria cyanosphaera]AFZ38180.1 hypothetical protein Sta7437_4739 [Stanieria cyanosphaera PCC 7437]
MNNKKVSERAYAVFHTDSLKIPPMTLRAGNAVDSYKLPPPYDEQLDKPTDDYLQKFAYFALPYLDALSWRYYLPFLIDYTLRHAMAEAPPQSCLTVEGTLSSLRPPDPEPPRLSVLTIEQKSVIVDFLEFLAFDERSNYQNYAMQVLEEYWLN